MKTGEFYDLPDDDEPLTVRSLRFGRARILVVDDDHEMREAVAEALHADGYQVRVASSGRALLTAIASVEAGHHELDGVDLVVVDNRMPGMTGLDALRALRGAERTMPAILMTAYPAPHIEEEAMGLDATLLSKPFARSELTRTVLAKLLGRAPLREI
jgi:CheY-like chemotaxis protein